MKIPPAHGNVHAMHIHSLPSFLALFAFPSLYPTRANPAHDLRLLLRPPHRVFKHAHARNPGSHSGPMRCSKLLAPAAAAAAAFRIDDDRDMEEDDCQAEAAALRGQRRQGAINAAGGWVVSKAGSVSSGSSSSLFSSTSSLTDQEEEDGDGATSCCRPDRDVSSSSLSSLTSSGSETVQMGGGPLNALSTMLEDLPPLRTGLSKHYQGKSQSFTSLADVSCVEDLAKKTTPYIRRKKAPRRYAEVLGATNRLSKTIAKKAPRAKPPAYQGKREMYRCPKNEEP